MSFLAILLFFTLTWGLGFSLGKLVRESENSLERQLMRVGIGLCAFIVLGIFLNAIHVPLDWRIFLAISVALPFYFLVFRKGFRPKSIPLKLKMSSLSILVMLLIFGVVSFMYISGAFSYPYLEDDDPWTHVRGMAFISVEKTAFANPNLQSQYVDPYPPSYDMILAILHQVSNSVSWTVKFFNALLISFAIVFFYFFARRFMGSNSKALFATFVLASVPAFMSHFIWAPALAMVLFFPVMYAFEMVKADRRWWIVAAVCFAALLLSHPTQAAKLSGMIAVYLAVRFLFDFAASRKSFIGDNLANIKAVAFGILLSLFWWGFKWRVFVKKSSVGFKGGQESAASAIQSSPNIFAKFFSLVTHALNPDSGTATRVYTFKDFFVASSQNMINNPVGLGVFAFLLMAVGVISSFFGFVKHIPKGKILLPLAGLVVVLATFFLAAATLDFQNGFYANDSPFRPYNWANPPSYASVIAISFLLVVFVAAFILSLVAVVFAARKSADNKRIVYLSIVLGWLLFAFLGVNSKTFNLPVGLFAFRFWMIFAVPVALLAAEGLFSMLSIVSIFKLDSKSALIARSAIVAIVVIAILFTSARPKFDLNTTQWTPGAFWSAIYDDQGRVVAHEMQVYLWLKNLPEGTKVFTFSQPDQVLGFDKYSCGWCAPEAGMRQRFPNVTPSEFYSFLKENGYEYFIIGGIEAKSFGANQTIGFVQSVGGSGLFSVASQNELAIVFRAN